MLENEFLRASRHCTKFAKAPSIYFWLSNGESPDVGNASHVRLDEEQKHYLGQLDTADMERYWTFRYGSITIGDLFDPEDLRASPDLRNLRTELYWRGRANFNYYDHSVHNFQLLQLFAAVKTSKLHKQFRPDQELTQNDLDAWINPLQFFLSERETIVVGIIWSLNLDCVQNSLPLSAKRIKEELESKGLCFNVCPHYKLNQPTCISAMHMAQTQSQHYQEKQRVIEKCSQCPTIISFKVDTPEEIMIAATHRGYTVEAQKSVLTVGVLRDLGFAKSVVDPHWKTQWQREKDVYSDDLASRATYEGDLQSPPTDANYDDDE